MYVAEQFGEENVSTYFMVTSGWCKVRDLWSNVSLHCNPTTKYFFHNCRLCSYSVGLSLAAIVAAACAVVSISAVENVNLSMKMNLKGLKICRYTDPL